MGKVPGGRQSWASGPAGKDTQDDSTTDDGSGSESDLGILSTAQKQARGTISRKIADELAFSDSAATDVPGGKARSPILLSSDEEQAQKGKGSSSSSSSKKGNNNRQDINNLRQQFSSTSSGKRQGRTPGSSAPPAPKHRIRAVPARHKLAHRRKIETAKQLSKAFGEETEDDEHEDEDEDAISRALPDYLKQRRRRRDANMAQPEHHVGLATPPCYDDIDFSDDDRMSSLQEKPLFPLTTPCAAYQDVPLPHSLGVIPASIAQWLKQYQVEGAAFLHQLFVLQKGGILGDDMGLGKTIQVVAALTAAFGKTGDERDAKRMRKFRTAAAADAWYPRVLIVCPGGLMDNWKYELAKWGWWVVYTFHGSVQDKENALHAAVAGRLEIMITTYTTYRINKDTINRIAWDCVIADECHIIKERQAEITQAMNQINALCRIGLTGTAIQNRYEELWSLLNWANPGALGPLVSWKSFISEPLRAGQAHDATTSELSKARKVAKKLVDNLLPNFFLRRTKALIAHQLPKKTDRVVFCPLTPLQADAYQNFIQSDQVQYIKTSTDPCDCGSDRKRGWCCYARLPNGDRWQAYVFPAIHTLRNLANHIALLIPSSATATNKDESRVHKELDTLKILLPNDWSHLFKNRDNIVTLANRQFCGKWLVLNKLLQFWHSSGDKVLVFSHSVRLLKLLSILLQNTTYNVSYLDGSMTYQERTRAVDDFNADPTQFVFLISTRAGGVGLNITSANKVVVVDPNWNPSHDLQAQDRAYRIGQTRDVEVFRLISVGTIEEIVYARQIYKQQQANIGYTASLERRYFKGVQQNSAKKGEIFGLHNLLSYQGENIVLRDIVNKTNIAESRAGVQVVGLDADSLDDQDDPFKGNDDAEDTALSQLAELITGGNASQDVWDQKLRAKKTDVIQGILAGAGVQYTHSNAEVIGSSKIETSLSRRAEEAGNNLDERVFEASQSQSQNDTLDDPNLFQTESDDDDELLSSTGNHDSTHGDGLKRKKRAMPIKAAYRYHPPEEVRKRQFCTMAKTFGYSDVTQFALEVESWTQAQRRACLDKFYDKLRRGEVPIEE